MILVVQLPGVIGDELAAAIEDQGPYLAPQVERLRVSPDRSQVVIEYAGDDETAIRPIAERYLSDFVHRFRDVGGRSYRRLVRQLDTGPLERGVFEGLRARGWAFELGRGQIGLAGPALRLVESIDGRFKEMAIGEFGAVEHRYPTLIPTDVLHRCGYFGAFPHLVALVGHFREDYEVLKRVRDANAGSERLEIPDPDAIVPAVACLTPATCYHVYQALEAQAIAPPGRVFTAAGRCGRYESRNLVGLERLWEFTMREMVLVGDEEWVTDLRRRGLDAFIRLIEEWDLECAVETASDPFFAPVYASRTFWQAQGELKYELRLTIEPDDDGNPRTISCGSANLHEGFFGHAFDLRLDGSDAPVHTGCVALGVERLALAVFTQHGFDPARWPRLLRQRVFE